LPALAAAGIPVFLTGDFNTPSHLDWTEAVSKHRPHVRYAVPWPMSRATEAVGLRDSFREAHPDPIEVPGFTWSPGGPECDPDEVHDRIDWVLAAGPAVTVASDILGEVGGVDVSHAVDRFPSDHRAVVSTFRVTPADTPALVAVDARRVFAGDQLTVSYRSAPDGAEIAIMAADGSISAPISPQPIKANPWPHGAAAFDTGGLAPGRYDAVLLDGAGEVLSRSPFWLYPRGMSAELTVSKTVFKAGETVAVTWRAAPGNRWDWLAIIPATAQVPESSPGELTSDRSVLRHIHTDAQIEGSARFDGDPRQGLSGWPLPPGQYEIRLLLDDGYRLLASSPPFRVEP
jgi:hypothetical protein